MLLANVSGIRKTKLVVMTDSGVFTFMPKMIQIHETANEKMRTIPNASNTPTTPPAGAEAEDDAKDDDQRRGDRVAEQIAGERAEDRRRLPHRQRAEPVVEALLDVAVEADARVDGDEDDRLHQDPGEQELDVDLRRTTEGAPEDVREEQGEHDRRDGHVEQLERNVFDLQHRAPGERAGRPTPRRWARRAPA